MATIIAVLLTILPVVVTIGKLAPKIFAFLTRFFGASKGAVGASGFFGILIGLLTFAGGIGFFVWIVINFDFQLYTRIINVVVAPFCAGLRGLVQLLVSALPPRLSPNVAVLLGLFNWGSIISLISLAFSIEFYMRLLMIYFVRRGR